MVCLKGARRKLSTLRLGRCVAVLAATAFLLPFTILVLVADQQFKFAYSSKRAFYQESDFYKINGSLYVPANNLVTTSSTIPNKTQFLYENGTRLGSGAGLLTRQQLLEVGERMDRRRDYLEQGCRRLGLDGPGHKASSWEYLINRQYHVIWCNVFKAASTSWMYNFNLMANYTAAFLDKTKEVPLELARRRYVRATVEMVRRAQHDSLTFIIVRHPLERLASAYSDKLVHAWPRSFHAKMGTKIIKKYRKKASEGERYPLFEEFVSYVLDEVRERRTLDMHWEPYTAFCTPCCFHFDAILKFETLEDDQKFLIQVARLQDVVKPEWRNTGRGTNAERVNTYYSRITRTQLDALYNVYKYDFQLFNYTMDNYYDMVIDG